MPLLILTDSVGSSDVVCTNTESIDEKTMVAAERKDTNGTTFSFLNFTKIILYCNGIG